MQIAKGHRPLAVQVTEREYRKAGGNIMQKRIISSFLLMIILVSMVCQVNAIESQRDDFQENDSVQYIELDENIERINVVHPTKNRAIIILPGTIGSKLLTSSGSQIWPPNGIIIDDVLRLKSQLKCNTSGFSENVIRTWAPSNTEYGADDTYKTLVQSLNNRFGSEYDILFFSYDWRLDVKGIAGSLKTALQYYPEVILVCHSMGGIVGSAYVQLLIDTNTPRPVVSKMITIGTPYTGSAKAVHVMETGELIANKSNDGYLLTGTLKELAPNFTSVYQLLPTKDYSINYLSVGNVSKSHSQARNYLKTLAWATNGGAEKPLWNNVDTLYAMLCRSGTHIANNSSLLETYKLYGTGKDTISKVNYNSNKAYGVPTYNNAGDGTVLSSSATNGSTTKTYKFNGIEHTALVKNGNVINTVIGIINGTKTASYEEDAERVKEKMNERGWIIGTDNRRINVILDKASISEIEYNGTPVFETDDAELYTTINSETKNVGHSWSLGENRRMFVFYDGNYTLNINSEEEGTVSFEYLDSGYYQKKEDYNVSGEVEFKLTSFENQTIEVDKVDTESSFYTEKLDVFPEKIWSKDELDLLNLD